MTDSVIAYFDSRRTIALPGDLDDSLEFSTKRWIDIAKNCIDKKGSFNVALSGGSTPKAIYERLLNYKHIIDWSKVNVYFSDERCVPMNDPESNYHMSWESGFKHLVKEDQMHPMFPCEEKSIKACNPEEFALAYEKKIDGVNFDLIMLGLGTDGHTASLFPETHALNTEGRTVVANFLPEKEVWRITFTYDLLNQADNTILYAFGKDKATVVKKIFFSDYQPERLPAQKVGTSSHPALWVLDHDATSAF